MVVVLASVPLSHVESSAIEAEGSVVGESNPPLPSFIVEHLVYSLMLLPPERTS